MKGQMRTRDGVVHVQYRVEGGGYAKFDLPPTNELLNYLGGAEHSEPSMANTSTYYAPVEVEVVDEPTYKIRVAAEIYSGPAAGSDD